MGARANHGRRTVLGFALAFLFVAGQASSFTHLAMVRHATCLEHGELIHLDETPPPAGQVTPLTSVAVSACTRGAADNGHDHCLISSSRREELNPPSMPSLPVVAGVQLPVADPANAPSLASVALLRLAPKSSPPA